MVFSPLPPPVPSLPLDLVEVSATGSLRKMGRRHSFFETSVADCGTVALLKPFWNDLNLSMLPPSTQLRTSGRALPLPALA
jgi:hypothetical protein